MIDTVSQTVNDKIYECLSLDNPKSFFLFAGAGSGKTRSLVEVLKKFRNEKIIQLRKTGKKIAIITYTNAACDEIKRRLDFDSAFYISTIHSFAWDLIYPYTDDIRNFIKKALASDIADLREKQCKAKSTTTKTYIDRASKIESKINRLKALSKIKKFTYNPNGDNTSRDSLSHAEVISITAEFIEKFPLMQDILVRKFPIMLIDESQDTKKELIDAFLRVQELKADCFALGMFGDVMQRIYMDGKTNLDKSIPDSWIKPAKTINYRCPKRVIKLINKIRSDSDGKKQEAYKDQDGIVRLFIVDKTQSIAKSKIEKQVAEKMVEITNDDEWHSSIKVLTLEHHMAARRGGFSAFFDPLYSVAKLKTGLLDGSLPGVSLFSKQILPCIIGKRNGDDFAVYRNVKKFSPLLQKEKLKNSEKPIEHIHAAEKSVSALFSLWDNDSDPTLSDILKIVCKENLFHISDSLIPIAKRLNNDTELVDDIENAAVDQVIDAWEAALRCPFSKFEEYVKYISDESRFGTHQGIKGLEFPRVMVILDDEDAKGNWFSYEKLFGVKELSETDWKNKADGQETGLDRTRRLFYVTCSRAEEGLAIVAYTKNPTKLKDHVLDKDWFSENEIILIGRDNE